jgi:hypothetical protein
MHGTLSVFMAESGLESNQNVLHEVDIVRLFKIHQVRTNFMTAISKPIRVLTDLNTKGDTDDSNRPASLIDVMFEFCLLIQQECFNEVSCQTDTYGPTSREVLDLELREIQNIYNTRQKEQTISPLRTIEEKMLAYQRECEARARQEVETKVLCCSSSLLLTVTNLMICIHRYNIFVNMKWIRFV